MCAVGRLCCMLLYSYIAIQLLDIGYSIYAHHQQHHNIDYEMMTKLCIRTAHGLYEGMQLQVKQMVEEQPSMQDIAKVKKSYLDTSPLTSNAKSAFELADDYYKQAVAQQRTVGADTLFTMHTW